MVERLALLKLLLHCTGKKIKVYIEFKYDLHVPLQKWTFSLHKYFIIRFRKRLIQVT